MTIMSDGTLRVNTDETPPQKEAAEYWKREFIGLHEFTTLELQGLKAEIVSQLEDLSAKIEEKRAHFIQIHRRGASETADNELLLGDVVAAFDELLLSFERRRNGIPSLEEMGLLNPKQDSFTLLGSSTLSEIEEEKELIDSTPADGICCQSMDLITFVESPQQPVQGFSNLNGPSAYDGGRRISELPKISTLLCMWDLDSRDKQISFKHRSLPFADQSSDTFSLELLVQCCKELKMAFHYSDERKLAVLGFMGRRSGDVFGFPLYSDVSYSQEFRCVVFEGSINASAMNMSTVQSHNQHLSWIKKGCRSPRNCMLNAMSDLSSGMFNAVNQLLRLRMMFAMTHGELVSCQSPPSIRCLVTLIGDFQDKANRVFGSPGPRRLVEHERTSASADPTNTFAEGECHNVRLGGELEQVRSGLVSVAVNVAELEDSIQALKGVLPKTRDRLNVKEAFQKKRLFLIQGLEKINSHLRSALDKRKVENQAADENLPLLANEVHGIECAANAKIVELEYGLQDAKKQQGLAKSDQKRHFECFQELQKTEEELRSTIADLESSRCTVSLELSGETSSKNKLVGVLEEASMQVCELQNSLQAANLELEAVSSDRNRLKDDTKEAARKLEELQARKEGLENDSQKATGGLVVAEAQIHSLDSESDLAQANSMLATNSQSVLEFESKWHQVLNGCSFMSDDSSEETEFLSPVSIRKGITNTQITPIAPSPSCTLNRSTLREKMVEYDSTVNENKALREELQSQRDERISLQGQLEKNATENAELKTETHCNLKLHQLVSSATLVFYNSMLTRDMTQVWDSLYGNGLLGSAHLSLSRLHSATMKDLCTAYETLQATLLNALREKETPRYLNNVLASKIKLNSTFKKNCLGGQAKFNKHVVLDCKELKDEFSCTVPEILSLQKDARVPCERISTAVDALNLVQPNSQAELESLKAELKEYRNRISRYEAIMREQSSEHRILQEELGLLKKLNSTQTTSNTSLSGGLEEHKLKTEELRRSNRILSKELARLAFAKLAVACQKTYPLELKLALKTETNDAFVAQLESDEVNLESQILMKNEIGCPEEKISGCPEDKISAALSDEKEEFLWQLRISFRCNTTAEELTSLCSLLNNGHLDFKISEFPHSCRAVKEDFLEMRSLALAANETLMRHFEGMKSEIPEVSAENQKLQGVKGLHHRLLSLEKENAVLRREKASIHSQLKDLEQRQCRSSHDDENCPHWDEVQKCNRELLTVRDKADREREIFGIFKKNIRNDLKVKSEAIKNLKERNEKKFKELKQQLADCKTNSSQLFEKLEESQEQNVYLKRALRSDDQIIKQLEKEIKKLVEENASLLAAKGFLERIGVDINKTHESLPDIQKKLSDYQSLIEANEELNHQNGKLVVELESSRVHLETLTSQIAHEKSSHEQLLRAYKQLESNLESCNQRIEQYVANLQSHEAFIATQATALNEINASLANERAQLVFVTIQNRDLQMELVRLTNELISCQSQFAYVSYQLGIVPKLQLRMKQLIEQRDAAVRKCQILGQMSLARKVLQEKEQKTDAFKNCDQVMQEKKEANNFFRACENETMEKLDKMTAEVSTKDSRIVGVESVLESSQFEIATDYQAKAAPLESQVTQLKRDSSQNIGLCVWPRNPVVVVPTTPLAQPVPLNYRECHRIIRDREKKNTVLKRLCHQRRQKISLVRKYPPSK